MTKKSKKKSTLYYFHSVGCAFCKQIDPIVEKLNSEGYDILSLDMSENDNRGLHREIENKYDLRCGTPFLVDASNGKNVCGNATEEMIKAWVDGEEIPESLEQPKPKSPPPPLPKDWNSTEEVKKFTNEYDKWVTENNHIPNLQTVEQIMSRFKPKSLDGRVTSIEQKLDRLMNHLGVE